MLLTLVKDFKVELEPNLDTKHSYRNTDRLAKIDTYVYNIFIAYFQIG